MDPYEPTWTEWVHILVKHGLIRTDMDRVGPHYSKTWTHTNPYGPTWTVMDPLGSGGFGVGSYVFGWVRYGFGMGSVWVRYGSM